MTCKELKEKLDLKVDECIKATKLRSKMDQMAATLMATSLPACDLIHFEMLPLNILLLKCTY